MTYSEARDVLSGKIGFGYARKLARPNPNRQRVKVANNTYLERRGPQTIALRFHATDVVTWTPHYAEFQTGGFHTVTTADRMSYGPGDVGATRNGWAWFAKGEGWSNPWLFYDGLRVDNAGTRPLKTQPNKPARFEPIVTRSGFSGLTRQESNAARGRGEGWFPQIMKQSDLTACPFVIFEPSHYREDGSCKCNDPAERERMKREWEYTEDDFRNAGLLEGVTNG